MRTVVLLREGSFIVQVALGEVQGGQSRRVKVLHEAVVEKRVVVALAPPVVGVPQLRARHQGLGFAAPKS